MRMSQCLLKNDSIKLYLLGLVDMKYINLDKSYITPSGKVLFNIDIDKVPKYSENTEPRGIFESTLFNFAFNTAYVNAITDCNTEEIIEDIDIIFKKNKPNHTEEYYIPFVVCSKAKTCRIDTFAVKYKGMLNSPPDDYIKSVMEWLQTSEQSEYKLYKKRFETFSGQAIEWVKQQIRDTLLKNTLGNFCADDLQRHTYSCRRKLDDRDIFYVIYEWWRHLREGSVKWMDIDNGEGNIFVVLNK